MKTCGFWTIYLSCSAIAAGGGLALGGSSNDSPRVNDACRSPNGEDGRCVPLRMCKPLFAIIHHTPISPLSVQFLRSSECGFARRIRLFCCANNVTSPPAQTTTEAAGTTIAVAVSSNEVGVSTTAGISMGREVAVAPDRRELPEGVAVTSSDRRELPEGVAVTSSDRRELPGEDATGLEDHPNYHLLPANCGPKTGVDSTARSAAAEASLEEHPWNVLLRYKHENGEKSFGCAGVLISRLYVLTAAHCTTFGNSRGLKLVSVRVGEHDLASDPDCQEDLEVGDELCAEPVVDVPVDQEVVHPDFSLLDRNRLHDIALLRLDADVVSTLASVTPICLPLENAIRQQNNNENIDEFFLAGWGTRARSHGSARKWRGSASSLHNSACQLFFAPRRQLVDDATQLCALPARQRNDTACLLDDGGALLGVAAPHTGGDDRFFAAAIASHSLQSCGARSLQSIGARSMPSVFTRVAPYSGWVLDQLTP